MSRRFTGVTMAAVAACGPSCADTPGSREAWVRDSAGITIVTNAGPTARVPVWTTEPEVMIGESSDAEEYVFGEIADVAVDSGGRFLVLDRQAQRARVYGPDGRHLRDVGGPGEGPGELSHAATAIAAGPHDSIYIADFWQMRLNVYGPDGDPARTIPLRHGRAGPYDVDVLPSGRVLVRWFVYNIDAEGRFVPWDGLLSRDSSATTFDTLMVFDYPAQDFGVATGQLLRPLITNTAFHDVLTDGRIAWGALGAVQVALHDRSGTLGSIVRNTSWSRRSASADERAVLEALYLARVDRPGDAIPDNVVFPDTLPSLTALRASPDGGFWVQRMGPLAETDPQGLLNPVSSGWLGGSTWEVYGSDGRLAASVRVPARYRLTRILASSVVGIQKDELDVERVVRLRLIR